MFLSSDRCAELEGNLPLWLFCHSCAAFISRIAAVTSLLVIDKLPVGEHDSRHAGLLQALHKVFQAVDYLLHDRDELSQ